MAVQLPPLPPVTVPRSVLPCSAAGVGGVPDLERDLVAAQLAVGDRRVAERAGQHLEALVQRQRALRHLPRAVDLGRDDPQVRRAPAGAVLRWSRSDRAASPPS